MSLDLVSKSLELEDLDKGVSKNSKKKKLKTNDAMKIIKTDRQGVWKELRKVRKQQLKELAKKRKTEKFKSAIEMYKDEFDVDHTDTNIETLLRMSKLGRVKENHAHKILYQQPCRLSRDVKETIEEAEPSSLFTDEDFENFAKEYNPNSSL